MAAEIFPFVCLFLLIHVGHLSASKYMRACFFKSDSRQRTNEAKFTVQDIDFTLCTHYIYGYGKIDSSHTTITVAGGAEEDGPNGFFKEFNDGKKKDPRIKTMLSVGGPSDCDNLAFENLHAADKKFQTFPQNAIAYVKAHGFDGLNFHLEARQNNMSKTVMTEMLKALRKVIDLDSEHSRLLLTITGYAITLYINLRHNVPELNKCVDYVFVMSKYLHRKEYASFIGPLFRGKADAVTFNINESIHYWNKMGMPYNKLVMSVTVLGHYVKLQSASEYLPNSRATPDVLRGTIYNLENRLAYPEICKMMTSSQRYYDILRKNPYLVVGDEWVGYTDTSSLQERITFIKDLGLAGIQLTNLDEDDFSGKSCNNGTFPLVTFISDTLDHGSRIIPPTTTTTTTTTTTKSTLNYPVTLITISRNVAIQTSKSYVFRYFIYIWSFLTGYII